MLVLPLGCFRVLRLDGRGADAVLCVYIDTFNYARR